MPKEPKNPLKKLCIYCLTRPAKNNEHVVASCFFTRPLPPQMITVPSCRGCNAGRNDGGVRDLNLDEEYMRNAICMRHDMDHPVAKTLRQGKVIRSFENSPPLAMSFLKDSRPVRLRTRQGIFFPDVHHTMNVELPRIARVLKKIT